MNATSSLLVGLYGESGRHARKALGITELFSNAPIEVELIAEFESMRILERKKRYAGNQMA